MVSVAAAGVAISETANAWHPRAQVFSTIPTKRFSLPFYFLSLLGIVRLNFLGSLSMSPFGDFRVQKWHCQIKSSGSSRPVPFWGFQGVKTCFVQIRPDKHGRRRWLNNEKILTYDFSLTMPRIARSIVFLIGTVRTPCPRKSPVF